MVDALALFIDIALDAAFARRSVRRLDAKRWRAISGRLLE
jgi:hypothetical protein